jgi:iron(III) transport system permease protein
MRTLFLGIVAAFILMPLAVLFFEIPTAEFFETVTSAAMQRSLVTTVVTCGVGALLSVFVALPFARFFAQHEWKTKKLQRLLFMVPYLVPNFIFAAAYVLSWNPTSGILNTTLNLPLYGTPGLLLLFGICHAPLALLLIEEKLKRVDSSFYESARLSGASEFQIFSKIEFPILVPTLGSIFALCFALNLSAFAIPAWIGAPAKEYTLTYKIFQAIQVDGPSGIGKGATISVLLFVLAAIPVFINIFTNRAERRLVLVTGKASRPLLREPKAAAFRIFQLSYVLYQGVFWMVPLGILFLSTLSNPGCLQEHGLVCLTDLNFSSYHRVLFELDEARHSFLASLFYGMLSTLAVIFVSVICLALFGERRRLRIIDVLFSIPISTPGAIIALGLIVTYSGRFVFNVYNTVWILVLAFVYKHLNLGFQPIKSGYLSLAKSLSEAARLSGASSFQTWRHILLPLLLPECFGAFFIVMIPVLGELTMSIFLANPQFKPIGVVIYELQDYADQNAAAALSILIVIAIFALNGFARLVSRGRIGY